MRREKAIKRSITLIEMIVVMILIATITGAVAINYRKSLNEGRAFRTKEGIERVQAVLSLYYAEHPEEEAATTKEALMRIVEQSPLVKNAADFLRDGWGTDYTIAIHKDRGADVTIAVTSENYNHYDAEKRGIPSTEAPSAGKPRGHK